MIQSVKVTNYLGESLTMELANPEKTGLLIYNITGIGGGKADINFITMATGDGSLYNSARLQNRNIVFMIRYLWVPTIEDSRHLSYKFFPLKKEVDLVFHTDTRDCHIVGRVESNEPVIFEENEYTQISIMCGNPYFDSGVNSTTTAFHGVEPLFEFPFENDSLTEPLFEFGNIVHNQERTIVYDGDSEIGVTFYIHAIGEARNITIYNVGTRESMHIDTDKLQKLTGKGIQAGDEIIISTVKGKKYVRLWRGGVYVNILNCLDRDADWIQLSKGDNVIAYTAEYGSINLQFRIENKTLYEGV